MKTLKLCVFFLLSLLALIVKVKAVDESLENQKNPEDENSKEMTVLEDLQAQINELKQSRLRDKRKIENLEKEIKGPKNFRSQEKNQIENIVTAVLETFKLEQKSESQKLKDRFELLEKQVLLLGNEQKADEWILQPLVGPPGEKGQSGNNGQKGEDGTPGDKGVNGLPGLEGKKGEPGEIGRPGERGISGVTGLIGEHGDRGQQGPVGPEGKPGKKGEPGDDGSKGEIGLPGAAGKNGEKGETGVPGEIPTAQLAHISQTLENLKNSVQILKLGYPKSCDDIDVLLTPQVKREIYPNGRKKSGIQVLCDFGTGLDGWTMIQKRSSGPKEEFFRDWADYEDGFGSLDGNFWIGLKWIHALTKDRDQELRIDLWDFEGDHAYAKYSNFSISDSLDFYRISIDGYSGTAGDSMTHGEDNLNGMRFTTKDKDNDNWGSNCALDSRNGGWWYTRCGNSNLNGLYYEKGEKLDTNLSGISWYHWKNSWHSLQKVEMKIRKRR